jgi:DNA-binding response OmpR family regulator
MRPPEQQLRREQIIALRRMLVRLEEMEQAEQLNAAARRAMATQIECWLDSVDTTRSLAELVPQDSATLTATETGFGSNREVFRIKGRIVRLPTTLAKLLRALAVSSPGTWKTAKDLAGQFGNHHTITQAVYRLRKELRCAGLDGRMIESRRGYGWRWKAPDKG